MDFNYMIVEPNLWSDTLISCSMASHQPVLAILTSKAQCDFFDQAALNSKWKNIVFQTFDDVFQDISLAHSKLVIIAQVPTDIEYLNRILKISPTAITLIFKNHRKFINFACKKLQGAQSKLVNFTKSNLIGASDRLRQLVDLSYDMNRLGFQAYADYLKGYSSNPLQRVFTTTHLDVANIAKCFGFDAPPRVKDGKFITVQAQKRKKMQKKSIKAKTKRIKKMQQNTIDESTNIKENQKQAPNNSKTKVSSTLKKSRVGRRIPRVV